MTHFPFPVRRATLAPPRMDKLWMPREQTLDEMHESLLIQERAYRKKMKAIGLSGSHRIPPFMKAQFVDPHTERDAADEDYDSERDEHHINDGLDDDDGYDDEDNAVEEDDDDPFLVGGEDGILQEGEIEAGTPSVEGEEEEEEDVIDEDNDDMDLDIGDIYMDPSEYGHDVDETTHHLHQQYQYSDRQEGSSSSPQHHHQPQQHHYQAYNHGYNSSSSRPISRHHPPQQQLHSSQPDSEFEMLGTFGGGGPTTDQLYTDQDYQEEEAADYYEEQDAEDIYDSAGNTPRPSP